MKDIVNHPEHYTGKIECIDAIEQVVAGLEADQAYFTGNILKYIWRWPYKNGIEDLKKAQWYLNRLISNVEKEEGYGSRNRQADSNLSPEKKRY